MLVERLQEIETRPARQRRRMAFWCLITFHLQLLGDLLGSRGPSIADLWPIGYGEPLFRQPVWCWKGQWRLDGWQTLVIFMILFGVALRVAIQRGHSSMEGFSRTADTVLVGFLRKWRKRFSSQRME